MKIWLRRIIMLTHFYADDNSPKGAHGQRSYEAGCVAQIESDQDHVLNRSTVGGIRLID